MQLAHTERGMDVGQPVVEAEVLHFVVPAPIVGKADDPVAAGRSAPRGTTPKCCTGAACWWAKNRVLAAARGVNACRSEKCRFAFDGVNGIAPRTRPADLT